MSHLYEPIKQFELGEILNSEQLVEIINNKVYHYEGASNSFGNKAIETWFDNIPTTFNSATTTLISTTILDSTRVLVAYQDNGNSNFGTAIILSISNTTITAGSEFVFNSGVTNFISVSTLDSTRVLVAYQDNGNSNFGTAIILSINNLTITAGSEFVFNSAITQYISVSTLDSTRVCVAYQDNGNSSYGTAIILSINNLTITAGSEFVFNSAITTYCSIKVLDSTRACVIYRDSGNSNYETAIILNINALIITSGIELPFTSTSVDYMSVTGIDSTRVCVAYRDTGNSNFGTAIILSINNLTITAGSALVFNNISTLDISATTLDNTRVLVSYKDTGNSNFGTAIILSINNLTITSGSSLVFNSAITQYISSITIDNSRVLIAYVGNNNYGYAKILNRNVLPVNRLEGKLLSSGLAGDIKPVFLNKVRVYE